jgi:hypothetical protein
MFKKIEHQLLSNSSHQGGQVLILALVLLALVSLILPPLLNLAGSALIQGSSLENQTTRIYAADAGVESAWKNISIGDTHLPSLEGNSWGPYQVNNLASGLSANVTITLTSQTEDLKAYTVQSTSTYRGKSNTIEANMTTQKGTYSYFMDNIFSTQGDLYLKNHVLVNGFIQCQAFSFKLPAEGTNYGVSYATSDIWPSAAELRDYYSSQAHNSHSGGYSFPDSSSLTSNEYVNGNCTVNSIDLNGKTIFADGGEISVNGAITGPGCLVATGDVNFSNHLPCGDINNGVLVFSLTSASFDPGGAFFGWIAAKDGLSCKNGNPSFTWLPVNYSLNFPGLGGIGGPGSQAGQVTILTWKEN